MQFIPNGPDIPDRLLQAHEDGRVVFFCGAGISYPAGLPGFKRLTEKTFAKFHQTLNKQQQDVMKIKQYDRAFKLLEDSIVGGRKSVIEAVADILSPRQNAKLDIHQALLTLGRTRDHNMRLVTTNFDRLFERVIEDNNLNVNTSIAPYLSIPKNNWDSLVYLHGLLDKNPQTNNRDSLVLSSRDFGTAYLLEGWATRFVSELLRKYTVCFIGYSIDDSMMRYMMDALTDATLFNKETPQIFAFGDFSTGKKEQRYMEWKDKNVTPILYATHPKHSYLHKTLIAWAKSYNDGVGNKKSIITQIASKNPTQSTKQDDYIGRLLWALSDPSGTPAKHFSELNPVPSLDWLEPLGEERYNHDGLIPFGVENYPKEDKNLPFSMINRPPPSDLAPTMSIVNMGAGNAKWDDVMFYLARWLIRHLGDPKLMLWFARRGGHLHEEMAKLIRYRLNELAEYKADGKTSKLKDILRDAPKAIPHRLTCKLWHLMLSGHVKSHHDFDFFDWLQDFEQHRLTWASRKELLKILSPNVSLKEPLSFSEGEYECKINLSSVDLHHYFEEIRNNEKWVDVLPNLLTDFNDLLHETLGLMHELNKADSKSDHSFVHQPSISEHGQNKKFYSWTILIELTRDSWLKTAKQSPQQAIDIAVSWHSTPYPLFKRMAFFAAAQPDIIPPIQAHEWLLSDDGWWLWSIETKRETMRLLVALAKKADRSIIENIKEAIRKGPPNNLFKMDLSPEELKESENLLINERLEKIDNPYGTDERKEFSVWHDFNVTVDTTSVPRKAIELAKWLQEHPKYDHWAPDDWQQLCDRDFDTAAGALRYLAEENIWPVQRWQTALNIWSGGDFKQASWHKMAPVIAEIPNEEFSDIAYSLGPWLKSAAKSLLDSDLQNAERQFIELAERILKVSKDNQDEDIDDATQIAINHPTGIATEALFDWWGRSEINDGDGIPDILSPIFTSICNIKLHQHRHGRTILASRAVMLFLVDPEWTKQYLLPLFDWRPKYQKAISPAVWNGLLYGLRRHFSFMEAIKDSFLKTAQFYETLGEIGKRYAVILTYEALESNKITSVEKFRTAINYLPNDGLVESARALTNALRSADDQRSEYWKNRVVPYIQSIWPKGKNKATQDVAQQFGYLCLVAEDNFPDAVNLFFEWLKLIQPSRRLFRSLETSGLCEKFPKESLDFLLCFYDENMKSWDRDPLLNCLRKIMVKNPKLMNHPKYFQLKRELDT